MSHSTSSVTADRNHTAGAAIRDSRAMPRPTPAAIASGRLTASRFGTSSPSISVRKVMTTTTLPNARASA